MEEILEYGFLQSYLYKHYLLNLYELFFKPVLQEYFLKLYAFHYLKLLQDKYS